MSFEKRSSRKQVTALARTYRVPGGSSLQAIQEVLSGLDCPRSLAVSIILRDDPAQLKTLAFDQFAYPNGYAARDAYLATEIAGKSQFLKTGIDLKKVAMEKFWKSEDLCRQTNFRLRHLDSDPKFRGPNVWLLNAFTRKISSVLVGYSPDELFDEADWGPGVTTLLNGSDVSSVTKFQHEVGITRDLYSFIQPLMKAGYPTWADLLSSKGSFPKFEVGNKVTTVPKTAFTDRVIAVEPGINLWFQKGVGNMIRKRLKVHGIDLNSQERNQSLARSSSKDGKLATIDFSSASDTISEAVVSELFPSHWQVLLDRCRSHFGIINGAPVRWNKFSSMGNGFTFELESLIFFCAAVVVCEYLHLSTSDVSVYGDDVIIPVEAVDLFSSFCDFLGFTINQKKSFSSGPFRESCGSHYFDGLDLKPIYLKVDARNLLEIYRQLNAIRRLAHRRGHSLWCDSSMKNAWLSLFRSVPRNLRFFGPDGRGDGFIIGNFDEACPVSAQRRKRSLWCEGFYVQQFQPVALRRASEEVGLLLARLRNRSIQEYGNYYTLRGRTRLLLVKSLVPSWVELGPWV
jgi:hypothetical protein